MVNQRIHWPPPVSTPREAPWREIEEIIAGLGVVVGKLDQIVSAIGGISPGGEPSVFDGRLDILAGALEWGKATGGTVSTLVCMPKSWPTDIFQGLEVAIIKGTGVGQARWIKTNSRNTITPRNDFDTNPDIDSVFIIRGNKSIIGNKSAWIHGQQDVASAGTAEQLSTTSVPVPDGCQVTILAKPGNTGTIYAGKSKADCEDTAKRVDGLAAGLAMSLEVTDVNLAWVDAAVSGEGVSWFVEQTS